MATKANPVIPGETITVFATGLGLLFQPMTGFENGRRYDGSVNGPVLAWDTKSKSWSTLATECRQMPPLAFSPDNQVLALGNVDESISLGKLAAVAGLSVFHFARAFKDSQGVTPHSYVLEQRIERAQKLLAGTDIPISRIALATGFSDFEKGPMNKTRFVI